MKFAVLSLVLFATVYSHFATAIPADENTGEENLQIQITTVSGQFSLNIQPSDTIENIKLKIQDQEGINELKQRLIFNGQLLQDSRTVSDYNIQNGATLNLVFPIAL